MHVKHQVKFSVYCTQRNAKWRRFFHKRYQPAFPNYLEDVFKLWALWIIVTLKEDRIKEVLLNQWRIGERCKCFYIVLERCIFEHGLLLGFHFACFRFPVVDGRLTPLRSSGRRKNFMLPGPTKTCQECEKPLTSGFYSEVNCVCIETSLSVLLI